MFEYFDLLFSYFITLFGFFIFFFITLFGFFPYFILLGSSFVNLLHPPFSYSTIYPSYIVLLSTFHKWLQTAPLTRPLYWRPLNSSLILPFSCCIYANMQMKNALWTYSFLSVHLSECSFSSTSASNLES